MTGLDLVIVNYRTPADLAACLASLDRYPPSVPFTVEVVNVDPTDDDVEVGEEWAAHTSFEVNHYGYQENVGYAHACNEAAAFGEHPVIGLFNADVEFTEGALDECVKALMAIYSVGMLGPRQVDEQNRLTAAGIFGPPSQPRHRDWLKPDMGRCSDVRDDVVTLAGSALFVKRDCWNQLTNCEIFQRVAGEGTPGAFLPTELFYEETAACYHARAHGWKLVYYGPVKVIHKWHRAVRASGGARASVMQRSRQKFREFCDAHGLERD